MITLSITGPYTAKDQLKANHATKMIGRGSARSSTHRYALDFGPLANSATYDESDFVFVSAEGNRSGRRSPDYEEIEKAIQSNVTFLTDKRADRMRPYNIGEREVCAYLASRGYVETNPGVWTRKCEVQFHG